MIRPKPCQRTNALFSSLIAPIAARLHYLLPVLHTSSHDPTLKLRNAVIITQVEAVVSIVTATVPCLRPFMRATYTTWGGRVDTVYSLGYSKRSGNKGKSSFTASGVGGRRKNRVSQDAIPLGSMSGSALDDEITAVAKGRRAGMNQQQVEDMPKTEHIHQYVSRDESTLGPKTKDRGRRSQEDYEQHSIGSGDNDSERMIIRRDVGWSVTYQ